MVSEFFMRYPALHPFLLAELKEAAHQLEKVRTLTTYLILTILSEFNPFD
jgi:hypothetical protein